MIVSLTCKTVFMQTLGKEPVPKPGIDSSSRPARNSLMLLDSASMYFRAFFGVPDSVKAPDGTPVNAVRGFLDMVARLAREFAPARIAATWDNSWRPDFRVAALPSYKAHRVDPVTGGEEVPPALPPQVEIIKRVLKAAGVARIGVDGYEADDIIGTLTTKAAATNTPVDIVTGDRDLFQLVDDARQVRVLYLGRGVSNIDIVDQTRLEERHGAKSGPQYAQMAALRGDPSDGLAGVSGVGEKTALKLLEKFGGLEKLIAAARASDPGLTPTQLNKFGEANEYLDVAASVINVVTDIPIDGDATHLPLHIPDPRGLSELAEKWGLNSSVGRLRDALTAPADA